MEDGSAASATTATNTHHSHASPPPRRLLPSPFLANLPLPPLYARKNHTHLSAHNRLSPGLNHSIHHSTAHIVSGPNNAQQIQDFQKSSTQIGSHIFSSIDHAQEQHLHTQEPNLRLLGPQLVTSSSQVVHSPTDASVEVPTSLNQIQTPQNLSLSLPTHVPVSPLGARRPSGSSTPSGAGHSRDDCWSEGATLTLIDAWGERYLELNRGNLKQKHWSDVAEAVNQRESGSKPVKTDVQCKNRLDTLKKKYKLEKGRLLTEGGITKWPYYIKLDELIGPSKKGKKHLIKLKKDRKFAEEQACNNNNTTSSTSRSKDNPDMAESCPNGAGNFANKGMKKRKLDDGPFRELAKAILKFGEVYERIETAKQEQLIELEKQRMEFTKDLELQRMHLFVQTQVELAKLKQSKHESAEHYT